MAFSGGLHGLPWLSLEGAWLGRLSLEVAWLDMAFFGGLHGLTWLSL